MENETEVETTEAPEVEVQEVQEETESHESTLDVYADQTGNDFEVPMTEDGEYDYDSMTEQQLETLIEQLDAEEIEEEAEEDFSLPEKFKDVESLVKSYNNLESKVGNFKGAPEAYNIEGVDMDTPLMTELSKTAQELNMSNDGFSAIVNKFSEVQGQMQEANEITEMNNLGANAEVRIDNINSFLDNNIAPDIADSIRSFATTSAAVVAIEALIGSARPSSPASTPTQAPAPQDINSLINEKDARGNLRMETDSAFNTKVMKLMQEQW